MTIFIDLSVNNQVEISLFTLMTRIISLLNIIIGPNSLYIIILETAVLWNYIYANKQTIS